MSARKVDMATPGQKYIAQAPNQITRFLSVSVTSSKRGRFPTQQFT